MAKTPGLLDIEPPVVFVQRWYGRLLMLLGGTLLLTLAYAPIHQFYLAWVGLIPWLIVITHCRSYKSAAFWGWVGGVMFFIANMWWMAYVTFPGMVGLMAIMAGYWGVMGLIVYAVWRADTFYPPTASTLVLVTFAWTALEFVRGNFIWHGLPWLYLGHTQTPVLTFCQIADIFGVYGVTFWVVLINVVVARLLMSRFRWSSVRGGLILLVVLSVGLIGYGLFRQLSTRTSAGPVVMVVQPNYPQDNSGEKGAGLQEILDFHFGLTRRELEKHPQTDLVVWSETMLPAINPESRNSLLASASPLLSRIGTSYDLIASSIQRLAKESGVGVITGGRFVESWTVDEQDDPKPIDTRNSAYFIERDGTFSPLRFDKIHIVPFGEFIPFKESFPWLYGQMINLGPPHMDEYQLTPGDPDALTIFPLRKTRNALDLTTWRLATPICFEDIDSALTARMVRPGSDGQKRTDVLINITNDGWFKANQMSQHLQVAQFRSIENRVPTARSVNTGISGFIDSTGRTSGLIAAGTEGVSVAQVYLDPRITFYTRFGNVFAWACVSVTASMLALRVATRRRSA